MPGVSKTVCLRAFNEDLLAKPWQSHPPPPPPMSKRIAWPGGKIVSNKDEALASFLRRKIDQGQKLTSEQMIMLEKMVDTSGTTKSQQRHDNRFADSTGTSNININSVHNTRKFGGFGGSERSKSQNGVPSETLNLLHKLEQKVGRGPDDSYDGEVKEEVVDMTNGFAIAYRGRHAVDLTSLKASNKNRGRGGGGSRVSNVEATPGATININTASVQRRVLSDGQGGFSISRVRESSSMPPRLVNNHNSISPKRTRTETTFCVRLTSELAATAPGVSAEEFQDTTTTTKRPRSHGTFTSSTERNEGGEGRGAVGKHAILRATGSGSPATATAAVAIPAVYLEAEFSPGRGNGSKKNQGKGAGKKGRGGAMVGGRGQGGGNGIGKGSVKAVVNARVGGGVSNGGSVKRGGRGGGAGGGGGERSLEELMSGGLSSSRQ